MLFFLPLFLLIYFQNKSIDTRNKVLLVFSLIFYCWGGVRYVLLLAAMTFVGWFFGLQIAKRKTKKQRKPWLIASVAIFISVLVIFKYTGFFLGTLGSLIPENSPLLHIALPLGISFYTFKLISYVADIYKGLTEADKSYLMVLTYVSMFQHAVAGPIVRYKTVQKDLRQRKHRYSDVTDGIYRMCVGLAKKTIIANHCGTLAEQFLPTVSDISNVPVSGVWLGSLFYMLQLYLDFSAYSDIAIGLGQVCGFHFEENFNYPYIAASIKDFWRRWHISLSTFFRDYVYIPLGGNRVSKRRLIINLFVVWILTGLWHGASWNYVIWGLFFFVFIVLENTKRDKGWRDLPRPASHAVTLFIVFIAWIFFRFEDFSQMGKALGGLFGLNGNPAGGSAVSITFANNIFFMIIAILGCTPVFKKAMGWIFAKLEKDTASVGKYYAVRIVISLLFLSVSVVAMIGNSYTPFLYYQF